MDHCGVETDRTYLAGELSYLDKPEMNPLLAAPDCGQRFNR